MSNIIILLSVNKHKRANKNTCLLTGLKKKTWQTLPSAGEAGEQAEGEENHVLPQVSFITHINS